MGKDEWNKQNNKLEHVFKMGIDESTLFSIVEGL